MAVTKNSFIDRARAVLEANRQGNWTTPAEMYPHQWLWDSCFIAIGLSTYDPQRAAKEILSLFRGQWRNGMLPHIIFGQSHDYWEGPEFWRSELSPDSPEGLHTSGFTQPPLPALAAWRVAQRLSDIEARAFLEDAYQALVAYHRWLYRERDVRRQGLVALIHPWETGMDTTPPWMRLIRRLKAPLWLALVERLRMSGPLGLFRQDFRQVPPSQRYSNLDALKLASPVLAYRQRHYDTQAILARPLLKVESDLFNAILIAANDSLAQIAQRLGQKLPQDLMQKAAQTKSALESLWDHQSNQYFSRNLRSGQLIKVSSVSTLVVLFSGSISSESADKLVKLMLNPKKYWTAYPLPSVPTDSSSFHPLRYWQGPTWVNINWLVIQGLLKHGYRPEASQLAARTTQMIERAGFGEYFSPLSGKKLGADNFSWTAALYLDLLELRT